MRQNFATRQQPAKSRATQSFEDIYSPLGMSSEAVFQQCNAVQDCNLLYSALRRTKTTTHDYIKRHPEAPPVSTEEPVLAFVGSLPPSTVMWRKLQSIC